MEFSRVAPPDSLISRATPSLQRISIVPPRSADHTRKNRRASCTVANAAPHDQGRSTKTGVTMARTRKKIVRREWTKDDVRQMKSMAKARSGVQRISKALKRTPGATQVMAGKLGISLSIAPKVIGLALVAASPIRRWVAASQTLTKLSSLLQNGKYPALSRGLQFFESIRGPRVDSRKRF